MSYNVVCMKNCNVLIITVKPYHVKFYQPVLWNVLDLFGGVFAMVTDGDVKTKLDVDHVACVTGHPSHSTLLCLHNFRTSHQVVLKCIN